MTHIKLIKDAQDFFDQNKCSDAIRCWEEDLKLGKSLNSEGFGLMLKPYIKMKQESLRRVRSGEDDEDQHKEIKHKEEVELRCKQVIYLVDDYLLKNENRVDPGTFEKLSRLRGECYCDLFEVKGNRNTIARMFGFYLLFKFICSLVYSITRRSIHFLGNFLSQICFTSFIVFCQVSCYTSTYWPKLRSNFKKFFQTSVGGHLKENMRKLVNIIHLFG